MVVRRAESAEDRQDAWQIREAVFVREQGIAEELERDGLDEIAIHLIAREPDGRAVGTARIVVLDDHHRPVRPGCGRTAKIGRMAVLARDRGRGIGGRLLEAALAACARAGADVVELSAQAHALGFYARHGFTPEGRPYREAEIPHRRMVRRLGPSEG